MKKIKLYFLSAVIVSFSVVLTDKDLLSADQNLIQLKCTKCHKEKIPDNYTKAEWKYNVERMAKRAGLTDKEIQIIIDMNKKK